MRGKRRSANDAAEHVEHKGRQTISTALFLQLPQPVPRDVVGGLRNAARVVPALKLTGTATLEVLAGKVAARRLSSSGDRDLRTAD